MMDSDERITALKKAYAEIILNTAKEAGARVMVSERKAQRFENELKVAKEESLRLLLRLKHMMDAKIREAELMSLSQQKKIEELEAQLHEAEDIVTELREELREVQSELERVTKEKVQHLNGHDIPTQGQMSEVNRLYTSGSVDFQPPESQAESIVTRAMEIASQNVRNDHDRYFTSIYRGNSYCGSPDLPSIIFRSKGPELYRNGCTHRIRACDRNLLDQELSLSGQVSKMRNEKSIRVDKGGKVICKAPNHAYENGNNFGKKVVQAGRCLPRWSVIKKRNKAVRYRNNRMNSFSNNLDQSLKIDQAPDTSFLRNRPISARYGAHSGENPSDTSPRVLSDKGEPDVQTGCVGTSENELKLVMSGTDQSTKNANKVLTSKRAVHVECSESPEVPICEMNLGKSSPPSMKLQSETSETSNGCPSRILNDRIFKYTFQRKRKRESSIRLDENMSPRNNVSEENVSVEKYISDGTASLEKSIPHENASQEKSTSDENTSLENNTFDEQSGSGTEWY